MGRKEKTQGKLTGEVIVTDSTHIKASAAKDQVQKVEVTQTPSQYLNTLEEADDKRTGQSGSTYWKRIRRFKLGLCFGESGDSFLNLPRLLQVFP